MVLRKFAFGIALLLCSLSAPAAKMDELRKSTENSAYVTGSIDIDPDGRVVGHVLDQQAALGDVIADTLRDRIASWRFSPPEMQTNADRVRATMRLQVVLSNHGENAVAMRIEGASFGDVPEDERIDFKHRPRLEYPREALVKGVTGNVYLVLRIGRDGRPTDVVAQQVNLTVMDRENRMNHWRDVLATSVVRQARRWRFIVPAKAADENLTVHVPIAFRSQALPIGSWEAYIPGPVQEIPWNRPSDSTIGVGAFAFGEVHTAGSPLRLISPLNGA